MKRKMITKTLFMSLIAGISLPAYSAANNNQKRIASTPDEQNTAATMIQANIRGALARSAHQDELTQAENDAAALIQAGISGTLARQEALVMPAQQNNSFFGGGQAIDATPRSQSSSYSSRASESSESSEDSDTTPEENIDARDQNGDTPLIAAAKAGQVERVRELIARGADINATDRNNGNPDNQNLIYGNTPLIWASINGHTNVAQTLITAGANIDAASQNGSTAIIWAIGRGNVEAAQILIEAGANIDIANQSGDTALMEAAVKGNVKLIQILIARGANVNVTGRFNATPLIEAVLPGHIEIIQILIAAGANIVGAAKHERTTLALSCKPETVQLLIDAYRAQLAKQHPENLLELLPQDLEQFEQYNASTTLRSMSDAFSQVGEIITQDMSGTDRNNFRAGCRLFRKAAINGKNIQSRTKKTALFSQFITQMRQQILSLKEKYTSLKQISNAIENVVALLDQELQHGHHIRKNETQNAELVAQAAPTISCDAASMGCAATQQAALDTMGCAIAQQSGPATAQQTIPTSADAQVACTTLIAERALRAEQETEYEQSLAIDQRRTALEEQIAALTTKTHAYMTEHDLYVAHNILAAPLEIRQQAQELLTAIITIRTELIELIQATQSCDEIFARAKAAQLAIQNEMRMNEQAQLEMIQNAIESYIPTREEIRAAREQYYGEGKGKNPA